MKSDFLLEIVIYSIIKGGSPQFPVHYDIIWEMAKITEINSETLFTLWGLKLCKNRKEDRTNYFVLNLRV